MYVLLQHIVVLNVKRNIGQYTRANVRRNETILFVFKSKQKVFYSLIMDVKDNKLDEIIASAEKAFGDGNYKSVISMVEPHLKERKKTLSLMQEIHLRNVLGKCYYHLHDAKSALPHSMRGLELAIQLCGKGSKEHAVALQAFGMVESELKDFKSATKRYNDAKAILKELVMEKHLMR